MKLKQCCTKAASEVLLNKNIMKDETGYSEAFEELQKIVSEMERGDTPVDELSKKIERAGVLIKICKEKLSKTEEDVNEILKELEK